MAFFDAKMDAMPTLSILPSLSRLAIAAVLSVPFASHAALGGTENSVQSDRQKMRAASRPSVVRAAYTVHEMQNDAGTTVREYVSTDGIVFAVTWSGPSKPDLGQLLGKYFARYRDANRTGHASHRHSTLRESDLVVHSSGHMRAFSGIAYLPQQVPQGVDIGELE